MVTVIGDVIEASARAEFNGVDDIVNVFEFDLITPTPVSDENTVSDIISILEAFYTIWLSAQSILVLYRDIRLRNKTQDTVLGTFPWPTLVDGENVNDALPPGVCGLLNFNTDQPRVTPRKYMGGLTTASMDADGSFTPGLVGTLVSLSDFLLSAQVEANGDWVYGTKDPDSVFFNFPISGVVTDIPAYQRRRKQGRGS